MTQATFKTQCSSQLTFFRLDFLDELIRTGLSTLTQINHSNKTQTSCHNSVYHELHGSENTKEEK